MQKALCFVAALLLMACGSEENVMNEAHKVDVGKGITFQFNEEAFVPGTISKKGTRAAQTPEVIDLGNGLTAEVALEPDTLGLSQTRAANPIPDGHYKIYAIDASNVRHDGIDGNVSGGVFTANPPGRWELNSGETYTFVCINDAVVDNGSSLSYTYSDNQTAVTINVLQGERSRAADNHSLGTFNLEGIPAAPRGVPQIEVTFDIDANGIVHVSAKDLGTGKENKVTISGSSNLSKEEIERMTKEAEAHAEEDKKFQELVEARNRADQLISATEKTLKENPDKVSEGDKKNIEEAIEELKKVKDGDDKSAIDSAMEKLSQASHKFAEELYKEAQAQAQAQQQAGANAGSDKKDEDVAEAEVVD